MDRYGRRLACGSVLACLAVLVGTSPAVAGFIFSPPGGTTSGNGQGVAPFANVGDTNGNRYQQVYSSSFFSSVGPRHRIDSVAFRPKQGALGSFIGNTLTLSDVIIQLSTTRRNADTDFPNGLNADLATNPGADARVVYRGALTLTTDRLFGDTDVEDFDFLINFQDSFVYDPSAGNLLLEVIIPAGALVGSNGRNFTQLDSFTDGFPSRDGTASATDANLLDGLTVGSNSTTGAVTRFGTTVVPEPASAVVFGGGVGLAAVAAWRRRRAAAGST